MKTKIIFLVLAVAGLVAPSCNNYLKEDSGDLLIPTTISEFQAMLYGSGYGRTFTDDADWIKFLTDDVEMNTLRHTIGENPPTAGLSGMEADIMYPYQWAYNIDFKVVDKFWTGRYNNILACNLVIDALPGINYIDSEEGKFNYLAAQAYALRAYHFFCLVNTYALPYSAENLGKPGVVLRLDPKVSTDNISQARATIGEVYDQINADLVKAQEYMDKSTPSANKHLLSAAALKVLRSRVALFQEKWDDVIEAGEELFLETKFIFDLNSVPMKNMGLDSYHVKEGESLFYIMEPAFNNEILFTFGDVVYTYRYLSDSGDMNSLGFRTSYSRRSSLIHAYRMTNEIAYDDSDDNVALYNDYNYETDNEIIDLRHRAYFMANLPGRRVAADSSFNSYFPIKYMRDKNKGYRENWRTVEVFLNMAEAYARKDAGISGDAISLLNDLRVKRVRAANYTELTPADFASKDQLVKFIWQERRRELCFEEIMRFWDLRRQGMPRQVHRWYGTATAYETYILSEKNNNYVMQIPASEASNTLMVSNPRDLIDPQ